MTPDSSVLTSEVHRFFDLLDRARNGLTDLRKRWNDSITFEGCSLREEYAKGRLSFACYLKPLPQGETPKSPRTLDRNCVVDDSVAVFVVSADTADRDDSKYRHDEQVLVYDVQVMQGLEQTIPSVGGIYLLSDAVAHALRGNLYYSISHGVYVPLSGSFHWEPTVARRSASVMGDDRTVENVQGRSEIVNCIPEDKSNTLWKRLGIDCDGRPPIGLRLFDKTARLLFEKDLEKRIQVMDVVVGPFDL